MIESLKSITRSKPPRIFATVMVMISSLASDSTRLVDGDINHTPAYSLNLTSEDFSQVDHPQTIPTYSPNKPCLESAFTNDTIRNNGLDSTILEVKIREACQNPPIDRIEAELFSPFFTVGGQSARNTPENRLWVPLNDKSQGKDKIAGDNIYTSDEIRYDTTPLPNRYNERQLPLFEDIPNLYQGYSLANYLKIIFKDGTSIQAFGTPKLLVLDENVPLTPLLKHQPDIQTNNLITNMRDNSFISQEFLILNSLDRVGLQKLTSKFYDKIKSDPFHYLTIGINHDFWVTTSDGKLPSDTPSHYGGVGIPIRRDFSGVGVSEPSGTETAKRYGSGGRLRQLAILRDPASFDHTAHEFIHWIGVSLPPSLNLTTQRYHWKRSNSAEGMLEGGFHWKDDGYKNNLKSFSIQYRTLYGLSPLELYLFGWIYPNDIPIIYVAENEEQTFSPGWIVKGPFKEITGQSIEDALGKRIPGPQLAPRDFQAGYLFITNNRLATQEEMTARELIAKHFSEFWNKITQKHSTMKFVQPLKDISIMEPPTNSTSQDLNLLIKYQSPPSTQKVHLQLNPFNNDGPSINLVISDPEEIKNGQFILPAPTLKDGPYIQLPDMSYNIRIRTSDEKSVSPLDDEKWSLWAESKFRTPKRLSDGISLKSNISPLSDLTPTLEWKNQDSDVYYYEIQLSSDPNFSNDPNLSKSPLYWNLVHGGVTSPPNSWTVPEQYPLKGGNIYYWRVRPRIQGDGTPVAWSKPLSFTTTGS